MISIITEITRRKLFRYASSDGFVFGFPMNEKVKISIFTFSDLIPIMTPKSQALVARTHHPLFSNFLFTNLFSITFLYFFIIFKPAELHALCIISIYVKMYYLNVWNVSDPTVEVNAVVRHFRQRGSLYEKFGNLMLT